MKNLVCLSLVLAACQASDAPDAAPPTPDATPVVTVDPAGSVTAATGVACPGGGPGTCTQLTLQCPSVADLTATVRLRAPTGTPHGTIVFTVGGPGTGFYGNSWTYGANVISALLSGGFATAELAFTGDPNGWIAGPGGPRKLACRYATAARWIHDHLHTAGAFCATGQSGGGAALAYGLAHYGLGDILDLAEPTGGPPMGRVDHGCMCDQPPQATPCAPTGDECYLQASQFLDWGYGDSRCSDAEPGHDAAHAAEFLADSIASPDATYAYPHTDVHALFGAQDTSGSVPQAMEWISRVTTAKTAVCIAGATHELPNFSDGADRIAADLAAYCRVQP